MKKREKLKSKISNSFESLSDKKFDNKYFSLIDDYSNVLPSCTMNTDHDSGQKDKSYDVGQKSDAVWTFTKFGDHDLGYPPSTPTF